MAFVVITRFFAACASGTVPGETLPVRQEQQYIRGPVVVCSIWRKVDTIAAGSDSITGCAHHVPHYVTSTWSLTGRMCRCDKTVAEASCQPIVSEVISS